MALRFALTATYTLAVVAAARHPDGLVGQWVNRWIMATDRILGLLLGGPLQPGVSVLMPEGTAAFRHVLLVCIVVVATAFAVTRRHRACWADALADRLGSPLRRSERNLLAGYRVAVLGMAASGLLVILGGTRLSDAGWNLYTPNWTFFRAPVLTSIGYWFACHAEAFHYLLSRSGNNALPRG